MGKKDDGQEAPQTQELQATTQPTQEPAAKAVRQPSAALKGHYEVVGVQPGIIYHHGIGRVDLRTVSLETAKLLHDAGCQYLRKTGA